MPKTTRKRKRAQGEGMTRKRTNGTWEGRITIGFDRQKSFYGRTQAEVLAKMADAKKQQEKGRNFQQGSVTLSTWIEDWIEAGAAAGDLRPNTVALYNSVYPLHVKPALGNVKLDRILPEHIERFYRELQDKGLQPSSISRIHSMLHSALQLALERGYIVRNPASNVRKPKVVRKPMQILNEEQSARLIAATEGERFEALYALAITTGMRQGELLGLKWDDVDFKKGSLRVSRNLTTGSGKVEFGEPKTPSSRRTIPLIPQVLDLLDTHRKNQAGPNPLGLVFPSEDGTPVHRTNFYHRSFEPLCRKAKMPKDFRFHDLRHTAASWMLAHGVNVKVVQEILGHASATTTLAVYAHALPAMHREAVSTLAGLLPERNNDDGE